MKDLLNRGRLAVALALGAGFAAIVITACGGGSSDAGGASPGSAGAAGASASDDGGGLTNNVATDAGGVSATPGSCPNPTVDIIFSPMHSAYIPGSTAHTFSIPAVTDDGLPATWSLSDPTQGHLQTQAFGSAGSMIPGVLITLAGTGDSSGKVTVVADEGNGVCGAAVLNITKNTEDDWNIGNQRYNNGVALHIGRPEGGPPMGGQQGDGGSREGGFTFPEGGFGNPLSDDAESRYETDGGTACTNCHGPTATNGPYKTVSHTPEQTGGFSDQDLENIILNGEVPPNGYFDPTVLVPSCDGGDACTQQAKTLWHSFHRWSDITADELPGVICYLRSLTPQSQTGASNFGGRGVGFDGGRPRRDGGTNGRPEAGAADQ